MSNLLLDTAIYFTSDNTTPTIIQIAVPGSGTSVGQNLTILAQAGQQQYGSNNNNNGGNLILSSGAAGIGGSGAAGTVGSVKLQAGTTVVAKVDANKFYALKGVSYNNTAVNASYQILATDCIISVGAITSQITLTLPVSPSVGDTYFIKDAMGIANTHNIVVSGNGVNIDGSASYTMRNTYECLRLTFTSPGWSLL